MNKKVALLFGLSPKDKEDDKEKSSSEEERGKEKSPSTEEGAEDAFKALAEALENKDAKAGIEAFKALYDLTCGDGMDHEEEEEESKDETEEE